MIDWFIKYCKDNQTTEIGQRSFMQKTHPKKTKSKRRFWNNLNFLAETNHIFIDEIKKNKHKSTNFNLKLFPKHLLPKFSEFGLFFHFVSHLFPLTLENGNN